MKSQLGMFAKFWQPGEVKTRLAATLGDVAAARHYQGFVRRLAHRFAHLADRRLLCCSPAARQAEMSLVAGPRWQVAPQGEGDLGARMAAYFAAGFAAGYERVVLIGSDSPDLPEPYVCSAFASLADHDVVLGPSDDGGYYLIGARGAPPPVFAEMPWSSPELWSRTTAQLQSTGTRWHQLPTWYDIDDEADLRRYQAGGAVRETRQPE